MSKTKIFFIIATLVGIFFADKKILADHAGDYYDNRDGDHARLSLTNHPGVTYMSSGYGSQVSVIADKVVIGNASLAYTSGDAWGSLCRNNIMLNSSGAGQVYQQYIKNNAYWYPEHLDHDTTDYFPAMMPAVNNSQGSSGSELDEVDKWFYALNAFPIDTKDKLKQSGLLMSTIQMIARRSRVASDEQYLTGLAHPNAFDNFNNRTQMEQMASSMRPDNIPPMVKLKVIEDDYKAVRGTDYFEAFGSEFLYDTPVSIARLFRSWDYTKRIVVSADDSFDANNLPLTYHWRVIRGDASHVRIVPRNAGNTEVEIQIDYHPKAVIDTTGRVSNLVSIGAFVHNGTYYSAPAFVTSYTMDNEIREYDQNSGRIKSITYNSNYTHPSLSTAKSWESDTYHYNNQGEIVGWIRRKGTESYLFTKEGYLVIEQDASGNPAKVVKVSYNKDATTKKLIWTTTGQSFPYSVSWDVIAPITPARLMAK